MRNKISYRKQAAHITLFIFPGEWLLKISFSFFAQINVCSWFRCRAFITHKTRNFVGISEIFRILHDTVKRSSNIVSWCYSVNSKCHSFDVIIAFQIKFCGKNQKAFLLKAVASSQKLRLTRCRRAQSSENDEKR